MSRTTLVETGPLRFVITDSPSDSNMQFHVDQLCKFKVAHVARASEPTYSTDALKAAGILCHEFFFEDGTLPPKDVVRRWLSLVHACFISKSPTGTTLVGPATSAGHDDTSSVVVKPLVSGERICVHCVAGLGRAPVLVAIALIEFGNLEPLEAIQFIRDRRRGAFNATQLKWLESYKKTFGKKAGGSSLLACVIL